MIALYIPLFLGFYAATHAYPANSQITSSPDPRAVAPDHKNDFLATATGDWRDVQCDHPDLTDALDPANVRWKAARAPGEQSNNVQLLEQGLLIPINRVMVRYYEGIQCIS